MSKFEMVFHSDKELKDFGVVNLNNSFAKVVEGIDLDKYEVYFGGCSKLFSDLLEGLNNECNRQDSNCLFHKPVLYNLSKNIVNEGIKENSEVNSMFRSWDGTEKYLEVSVEKYVDKDIESIELEFHILSWDKSMSVGSGDSFSIYLKSKKKTRELLEVVENSNLSCSAKMYLVNYFSNCYPFELDLGLEEVLNSIKSALSEEIYNIKGKVDDYNLSSLHGDTKIHLSRFIRNDDVLCHFINDVKYSLTKDSLVVLFNEEEVGTLRKSSFARRLVGVV